MSLMKLKVQHKNLLDKFFKVTIQNFMVMLFFYKFDIEDEVTFKEYVTFNKRPGGKLETDRNKDTVLY